MPRPLELSAKLLAATIVLTTAGLAQTTPADLPTDCSAYASIPLPPEAAKATAPKTPPSCASYRSYRGIGRPVNFAEARRCAWQERLAQQADLGQNLKEPSAWVVGGSLILADIYANGAGVPRNLPLAMRFACEFEQTTATGALPAIKKLNTLPPPHTRFELCDYAWTTFTATFCTDYQSEIKDDQRNRYYKSLESRMHTDHKTAFEKLLAAENAYVAAHASEVYQGGTIHNIRTLTSQDILDSLFHAEVVHYERNDWPPVTPNERKTAEGLLQREYDDKLRQLQSRPAEQADDRAVVTAEGLAQAQAAWLQFRDAWTAFARLRYPAAADAIRAQITLDRYRLLKTID